MTGTRGSWQRQKTKPLRDDFSRARMLRNPCCELSVEDSFPGVDDVIVQRGSDRMKHAATRLTRACASRHLLPITVVNNGTRDAG